jgi:hypothetical protein
MDTSIWTYLDWLIPSYQGVSFGYILLYILAGIFGALVRISYLDKPIRGLYRGEDGHLRMGFFAEIIVAVAVALLVNGHPARAGLAAIFAPQILNSIKNAVQTLIEASASTSKM